MIAFRQMTSKGFGMIRMQLKLNLPAALLVAFVLLGSSEAAAGLNSKTTKLTTATLSGTLTTCEPQILKSMKTIRLPNKATGVRYSGPQVGEQFDLDFDSTVNPALTTWTAEVTKIETKRRGSRYTATLTLAANPPADCAGNLAGPADWTLQLRLGAKYGMKAKDRFEGFMADYDGDRQRTSYTGNYHSLEFRDRIGLRTRYKVCASGLFGSQCWRRSTDSSGYSSIEASLAINDRIGQGILRWYVGGKRVASFRYVLRAEAF